MCTSKCEFEHRCCCLLRLSTWAELSLSLARGQFYIAVRWHVSIIQIRVPNHARLRNTSQKVLIFFGGKKIKQHDNEERFTPQRTLAPENQSMRGDRSISTANLCDTLKITGWGKTNEPMRSEINLPWRSWGEERKTNLCDLRSTYHEDHGEGKENTLKHDRNFKNF